MKKRLSVFLMFNARSIKKLLLTIAAMVAVNVILYVTMSPMSADKFPGNAERGLRLAFTAVLLLFLPFSSMSSARRGTHTEYVLKRLRISEKEVFFLKWASVSLNILILIFAELLSWYAIALYNSSRAGYLNGAQSITVQLVESSFIGSLLPFGDVSVAVRNIILVLMLGSNGAFMEISQMYRKGKLQTGLTAAFCCLEASISRQQGYVIAGIIVDALMIGLFIIAAFNMIGSAEKKDAAEFRKEIIRRSSHAEDTEH